MFQILKKSLSLHNKNIVLGAHQVHTKRTLKDQGYQPWSFFISSILLVSLVLVSNAHRIDAYIRPSWFGSLHDRVTVELL